VFEIGLSVGVFTAIIMALATLILVARSWLVATGEVDITVNEDRRFKATVGRKLLSVLADNGIHLPSACGGRGTCGQCCITVVSGGGAAVPVEKSLLSRRELAKGTRLSCQVTIRQDLTICVPSEILGAKKWTCTVRSNRNVSTLMKELVLELPEGELLPFRAGAYVQVTCPPHQTSFTSFDIDADYDGEWERLHLRQLAVSSTKETTRAYSLANHPGEPGIVMLVIRIAIPPPGSDASVPPGVVSSYLFGRRPGDRIEISGPYGDFCALESEREMIFVGGGAGMAPMRSIILDQLRCRHTTRKMSFWYGARNLRELFYQDEFDRLANEVDNFRWCVALSEPDPADDWQGDRGFIHEVLYARYLKDHPAPEECEYYLCGPPLMIKAVLRMLDSLGVERENIRFDDFGS
jgi:Na+-transporting NADH:ubiquinone oxidoreductase subunit F